MTTAEKLRELADALAAVGGFDQWAGWLRRTARLIEVDHAMRSAVASFLAGDQAGQDRHRRRLAALIPMLDQVPVRDGPTRSGRA